MSVQDLTNTTWVVNDSPNLSSMIIYGINFISNSYNYTELEIDDGDLIYYHAGLGTYAYDANDGWTNNAYKTITITGGTDATSATLIAWLEANAIQQVSPTVTVDLTSLSGWSNVSAGSHTLTIKAKATGYRDSNPSVGVSFTKAAVYSINASIQHASLSGDTSIITGGTATVTIVPNQGYTLPSTLTSVTNAQYSYDNTTGVITLSNATGAVLILGECPASGYSVRVTGDWNDMGEVWFYDGQDTTAPLLAGFGNTPDGSFDETLTITSGYLYCMWHDHYNSAPGTPSSGITVVSSTESDALYQVSADGSITGFSLYGCFIEGTQIALADGSKKAVEDITYDDSLLVWNFYKGKFDIAKPEWIMQPKEAPHYNLVKFDNGAELGLVGSNGYHRIFNKEAGAFTHTGCDETPNGTTTLTQENIFVKVVSQEIVEKPVKYYNIITKDHFNLFANGILTSCKLSNKYKIEDMKYVGDPLYSEAEGAAYWERIRPIQK